ncbi:MAG TPA: ribonuclease J [Spirochaetota bacterium]|nr:ribonuclease J [Spirochaetota bacterium]HOM38143.1 ribonuclease J [Spirochaetota bacterium]HPQ48639.1 ribonuclease J [Spirochaetota bacterium]
MKNLTKLRIIPLGGLGEIGKNIMVVEYDDEIVVIDCGIMFPDYEFLGVDLILPDFNYLKYKKDKIKGLLITHGHEDHIGGIPFMYKEIGPFPVFSPGFAYELIKNKFKEHGIFWEDNIDLIKVRARSKIKIGKFFTAEYIQVNHSIADSFAIAIHTPLGTILHTGDFKIDNNPVDNCFFDFYKFAELGEKGVLLLMSDSTNVERRYSTKTEREVGESLSEIVRSSKGRVIVATFASNISRVSQLAKIGIENNRKVAIVGRNMELNFQIARNLNYIRIDEDNLINIEDINNYPDDKLLIITTGSQGEPMSALHRIIENTHKYIKVKHNDVYIISASVIPGNEKTVSKIINTLFLQGAHVYYEGTNNVHVSGHAPADQQQIMLRLTNPKFFMPIHGEPRHLIKHADLAVEMGWEEDNIILARNGDVVEIEKDRADIVEHIDLDTVFVDANIVSNKKNIIKERKAMSEDGVIVAIIGLKQLDNEIECIPDIISKGFLFGDELKGVENTMKDMVVNTVMSVIYNNGIDYNAIKNKVTKTIQLYAQNNFYKKPMVIPRIIEIE